MGKLFGTDGVRGIANKELTSELAYKLGRFGGYFLTRGKKRPKMVVGMDTRISGDMLEGALSAGLNSVGIDVLYVGVVPTPAVACLINILDADGGVVISASHNPVEYNGIKFFDENSFKLTDDIENSIEEYILNDLELEEEIIGHAVGRKIKIDEPVNKYKEHIKETVDVDFKEYRVALDCGNGANYKVAPDLMKELGAEVVVMHNDPNGININVNCGSTNPEEIQKLVLETGADIGLSFDGDADRLIACDENGNIVDGDHILAICGNFLREKNELKKSTVVGTIMSNMGLKMALEENNMELIRTKVGDRYVLEEMRKNGYSLGGEQSGHIIFLDHNTTGDGLLTGVQLLNVMKHTGKSMSKLSDLMKDMPQVLKNVHVNPEKKKNVKEFAEVSDIISEVEKKMCDAGRVIIRPSGTEPLVRVMIEGENIEVITSYANEIAEVIEKVCK